MQGNGLCCSRGCLEWISGIITSRGDGLALVWASQGSGGVPIPGGVQETWEHGAK